MPEPGRAEKLRRMASYWIVVRRENAELLDVLSVAFRGRTGFDVVADRRARSRQARGAARPSAADRK